MVNDNHTLGSLGCLHCWRIEIETSTPKGCWYHCSVCGERWFAPPDEDVYPKSKKKGVK